MIFTISAPTQASALVTPTPALPVTGETAMGVGAASLLVGLVVLWLRRRLSSDGLEIAKDRAEGGMVNALLRVNENLTKENERLMIVANDAWAVRNKDAARIATLETQLSYLQAEMQKIAPIVRRSSNALENSGLMPLEALRGDNDD